MPLSDDKQLLAEWARHPGADVARAWLIEKRKAEEALLGKQLFADPASWDAIAVAKQAGRHSGRMEVLNQAWIAAQAIEREAQKATEES